MAIADITKEDVLRAIRWIDENAEPPGWESSKYVLVMDSKEYSPKYALARAHFYVTGSELAPGAFKSAQHANSVLKGLGFEVRERGKPPPSKNRNPSLHTVDNETAKRFAENSRRTLTGGQSAQGIVVDGNNVAYYENGHSPVDIEQLMLVFSQLRSIYGFDDVRIVVKASLRHEVDPKEYDRLIARLNRASKGRAGDVLHEVPPGGSDDLTVIRFAIDNSYMILSNDRYRDHIQRHPEYAQPLAGKLMKYVIIDGRLIIGGVNTRQRG